MYEASDTASRFATSRCSRTVTGCTVSSTDKRNGKSENVPVDGDVVLAQREKDLDCFLLRKQQIETLIKMMEKVAESITGESH